MNIFILDEDQEKNAEYHVDKHVVKMPIEAAQMLSTAVFNEFGLAIGYSPVYVNHPVVKWVGRSYENWMWTANYSLVLLNEFEYRFGHVHATKEVVLNMIKFVETSVNTKRWSCGSTPFHLAVAQEQKHLRPVDAYRAYYLKYKTRLFKWTKRPVPDWIIS